MAFFSLNRTRSFLGQSAFLRALAHRNFRLYFFGQGLSLIGTWMQQMALSWVVYVLAESRPAP